MKRILIASGLVSLFLLVLVARELLVHDEIEASQEQILLQFEQSMNAATSNARIEELTRANTVFHRQLEPIYLLANRLLWPSSRGLVQAEWKQSVLTKLEDLMAARSDEFKSKLSTQIAAIRESDKPSMARLQEILKVLEEQGVRAADARAETQIEFELIRAASTAADQALAQQVSDLGREKIRSLRAEVRQMSQARAAQFFSKGRFFEEYQTPVHDLILQIKSASLRSSVYRQYQGKIIEVISSRRFRNPAPVVPKSESTPVSELVQERLSQLLESGIE